MLHDDDLNTVLARLQRGRDRWFYRPYSAAELDEHPDYGRLMATLEAAVAEAMALEADRVDAIVDLASGEALVQ
jgi:hypothetical protein